MEAVCVLGNLAGLDATDREFVAYIPALEDNLTFDGIVLQVHSVRALSKMARAYPDQAAGILDHLLGVTDYFPGVKLGHLVEVMPYFADDPALRERARAFCEQYAHYELPSVASKARKALRGLGE